MMISLKYSALLKVIGCVMAILAIRQPAYTQISEFKLTVSEGGGFGSSVSISGDYTVVGAPRVALSAYLFKRSGTSWTQEDKLLTSDGAADDRFGWSVSISGDYAIIGASFDNDNGNSSGSAYVFKRTGTSWAQEAKLLPSDGAAFDWFGWSVSVSGDYTVLGASSAGSAYLFKRSGTSWVQEAKLLPSDGATTNRFGQSVSISGDYAVVGDDLANSAYVYSGIIVGIDDENSGISEEYSLSQNYPNPFNPETVIRYSVPKAENVSLVVYNLIGEEVAHLVDEQKPVGSYMVKWNALNVSSGIYFYRLQAGEFIQTRKMILLR